MRSIRQIVVRKNSCRLSVVGWKFGSCLNRGLRGLRGFSGLGIGVRNPSHNRTTTNDSLKDSHTPVRFSSLDGSNLRFSGLGIGVRNPSHNRTTTNSSQQSAVSGRESEFPPTESDQQSAISKSRESEFPPTESGQRSVVGNCLKRDNPLNSRCQGFV